LISKVSEVSRVYRTNELWHGEEETSRHRTWQESTYSSKIAAKHVFERYVFGQQALATAQGLEGVLTHTEHLKQAGEALLSPGSSMDRRTAESSNPDVLTATAEPEAVIRSYKILAKQIAKSQINTGAVMESNALTELAAGSKQMKLIMNDQNSSFSVYILQTDTNQQVLQKIRGAIQQTGASIVASLSPSMSNGMVRLELNSLNTGKANTFSIIDVYGNAAEWSGIKEVSQSARDAFYKVDDSPSIASSSNQILLDKRNVTVTLHTASPEPVELAIIPDSTGISMQVQALINRYNSLNLMLTQASGLLTSVAAEAVMGKLASLPLEELGLQLNSDGSLKLDTFLLEQQAKSSFGQLERSMRGFGGLAAALTVAANTLLDQPSFDLLDKGHELFQSFNNYQVKEHEGNPINTYLPVPLSGILMNDYI
jgi:flagellar hook-associated protein 2